jgi:hypothetical protein
MAGASVATGSRPPANLMSNETTRRLRARDFVSFLDWARRETARAVDLQGIARTAKKLGLRREYANGLGLHCRACGSRIGPVDAFVYDTIDTGRVATHATYPCTRRWLAFDGERFTDR